MKRLATILLFLGVLHVHAQIVAHTSSSKVVDSLNTRPIITKTFCDSGYGFDWSFAAKDVLFCLDFEVDSLTKDLLRVRYNSKGSCDGSIVYFFQDGKCLKYEENLICANGYKRRMEIHYRNDLELVTMNDYITYQGETFLPGGYKLYQYYLNHQ